MAHTAQHTPDMPTLVLDGDLYHILSTGVTHEGKTVCHLSSTTKFMKQKNGFVPLQLLEWVSALEVAAIKYQHKFRSLPRATRRMICAGCVLTRVNHV